VEFKQLLLVASILATNVYLDAQSDTHGGADSADRDSAAIIALEQRDAAAAKVNDVETLVSLWTSDGVLLQPKAQPVVGIAAIRQLLEAQRQQTAMIETLSYEEDWKERRNLGNEAYEWGETAEWQRSIPNCVCHSGPSPPARRVVEVCARGDHAGSAQELTCRAPHHDQN